MVLDLLGTCEVLEAGAGALGRMDLRVVFSVLRERIAQVRYERSGLFEENKFGAPGNIKAGAVLLVLVLVLVQKKKGGNQEEDLFEGSEILQTM